MLIVRVDGGGNAFSMERAPVLGMPKTRVPRNLGVPDAGGRSSRDYAGMLCAGCYFMSSMGMLCRFFSVTSLHW
jgi:hypothetical protein